jgi:hypothetical protein
VTTEQINLDFLADSLRVLAASSYQTSADHGFHDTDARFADVATSVHMTVHPGGPDDYVVLKRSDLEGYQISRRLLLTVSEIVEAFEEQRAGSEDYPLREMYYVCSSCGETRDEPQALLFNYECCDKPMKPDGFPAELADAIIRIGDLAHSMEIDLGRAVVVKANYNLGRPHKHGKAF